MAGHWYSAEGNLYGQVPTQKGGLRDFDLRDARKCTALPSVTSILSILGKPGLYYWQMQQVAKAAWESTIQPADHLDYSEWEKTILHKADEYRDWTAAFGTATHWWLNKKLRAAETLEIPPMIPGCEEVADGLIDWLSNNGYEFTHTEHRFARPDLGYAGTIDLVGTRMGNPCIVDLKTQEPPLTPWPEYPLQLAGYDYALEPAQTNCGCGMCDLRVEAGQERRTLPIARERISLIANRLNPGEVHEKLWVDKGSTVEATNQRYDHIWVGLVELWCGLNQYDPRLADA